MNNRAVSGRWLLGLMLLFLLGCEPAAGQHLAEVLVLAEGISTIEIVQQFEAEDGEIVLFYYTDTQGQRWLSVAEVRRHEAGGWSLNRRHSSLKVRATCPSPCVTFDVETSPGFQRVLLYGYTQHADVGAVEIELRNGRTLTRTVTERAFVGLWSDAGTVPGRPDALHQKIREINE